MDVVLSASRPHCGVERRARFLGFGAACMMLLTGPMESSILLTGGAGSIGTVLKKTLERRGIHVTVLDPRATGDEKGDVRDEHTVRRVIRGRSGIVHLAAVSRVAWAERAPEECHSTNVGGTRTLLAAALETERPPWVLFTSSREVHGEPDALPVTESAPIRPINTYGRSKAEGEALVVEAAARGLRTAVARLSNVYGSPQDHADRVIPRFVRDALRGGSIRVAGAARVFDFTHVEDVVRGLCSLAEQLEAGETLPPTQLVTGTGVSLGALARMIVEATGAKSLVRERSSLDFEVSRFVGDPRRAREILGWEAQIPLPVGLERLIRSSRAEPGSPVVEEVAS